MDPLDPSEWMTRTNVCCHLGRPQPHRLGRPLALQIFYPETLWSHSCDSGADRPQRGSSQLRIRCGSNPNGFLHSCDSGADRTPTGFFTVATPARIEPQRGYSW